MARESDSRHDPHGPGKGGIVRFEFDKLDDAPARHQLGKPAFEDIGIISGLAVRTVALIDEGHAEGAAFARIEGQDFASHALWRTPACYRLRVQQGMVDGFGRGLDEPRS